MGIADSDLATIRLAMNDLMPDTATIGRTTTAVPVRCAVETSTERLHDLPSTLRIPRWKLRVPDGTDVIAADVLAVPTKGTFSVLWVDDPASYTTEVVCHAIRTIDTNGHGPVYLPTPATFQNPHDLSKTLATHVYAYEPTDDLQTYGTTPAFPWVIVYDAAIRYAGGGQVGDGHRLLLPELFGTDGQGNARAGIINKPRPQLQGLTLMLATVKEIA